MTDRSEIIALALRGLPPRTIASRLGVDPRRIYNTLSEERRKGTKIPRFLTGAASGRASFSRVYVEPAILRAFEPASALRDMTSHELAAELLKVLAGDPGLVDAVLNDGVSA